MESIAPTTCEIVRLSDDLLAASLARTGPQDTCRTALVSPAFRAATDADAVWSSLLPCNLPALADGELPTDPRYTKKQLFMRLFDSARPVLLADGLMHVAGLDRAAAAKCYMLSTRKLCIIWGTKYVHPYFVCYCLPRTDICSLLYQQFIFPTCMSCCPVLTRLCYPSPMSAP